MCSSDLDNLEKNKKIDALACALKAVSICPMWWKTWLSLPYAFIGIAITRSMRGKWRGKSFISNYRKPCYKTALNEIFDKL